MSPPSTKSVWPVMNAALTGKAVLAAATGGTARHSLTLEHAPRPLFAFLRAIVVPTTVYAVGEPAELMRGRAGGARGGAAARTTDDVAVVPFAQQLEALRPA